MHQYSIVPYGWLYLDHNELKIMWFMAYHVGPIEVLNGIELIWMPFNGIQINSMLFNSQERNWCSDSLYDNPPSWSNICAVPGLQWAVSEICWLRTPRWVKFCPKNIFDKYFFFKLSGLIILYHSQDHFKLINPDFARGAIGFAYIVLLDFHHIRYVKYIFRNGVVAGHFQAILWILVGWLIHWMLFITSVVAVNFLNWLTPTMGQCGWTINVGFELSQY